MSVLQKIDEQTSARDLRAREILATARARLVGHVERNERVAHALATARANIVRLDPDRLSAIRALAPAHEQLQQQAAAARRQRVKRDLDAARATCARLADLQAPSRRLAQTVYKTDARRPKAPSQPSPAPVARDDSPQGEASYYEICREAIVEFILEKFDQERARWQREIDGLRREVDGLVRELDLVHRQRQSS
jgi:hypothetical protein